MKITYSILSILVPTFLAVTPVRANTYYFSSTKGDDSRSVKQAQQESTPWRSVAKLNQIFPQLQPGDSVLFQRGGEYIGTIDVDASGSPGNPIVLAAYGRGYDPIITGFSRLNNWKQSNINGVWQAPCPDGRARVYMVTIGNVAEHMGRFPNTGYLTVQQHTGNTSITDNSLTGGTDWTGAEVVIKKNRFIIDRSTVVSQNGGTLTLKGGSAYYQPTDNFGYFIENDIRTLDQNGEWYYDPKAHVMYVYSGGEVPADVNASCIDTLVAIRGRHDLVFSGLTMTGSNGNAFYLSDASNVTVTDCRIMFTSLDAVLAVKSNNLVMDHLYIDQSNDDGICFLGGSGSLITDCTIRNTGTVPGMGNTERSNDGIYMEGENTTVQYNKVDTTGYVGILFHGGPDSIKNNSVDYFCFVKDDGGGIYTWSGDIDSAAPRHTGYIIGNIVLDGITAVPGTDPRQTGIADGIYLDENTGEIEVSGNTVARCTIGIFIQDAHEAVVKDNTLYDNGAQLALRHALAKGTLRNNDISDNTAVAAKPNQTVLTLSSGASGEVTSFSKMHDNHYYEPGGGSFFQTSVRQNNRSVNDKGTISDWQSKYGKDQNSAETAPAGGVKFEYNATKTVKTVSLDRTYKDPAGKEFSGRLRLQPFTSEVLIPQ